MAQPAKPKDTAAAAAASFLRDADELLSEQSKPANREALRRQLVAEVRTRSGAGHRQSSRLLNRWSLLVCAIMLIQAYGIRRGYVQTPHEYVNSYFEKPCLLKAWMFLLETSRFPSNCEATCGNMKNGHVDIETYGNLTKERFERVYAIPARPVIVRNATLDWPAMSHFNLSFFRDLYDKYAPKSYAPHHYRQKLLPFRLPLRYRKLRQAFHMHKDDEARPWYFGWSNVDLSVHNELQNYYKVPNFLPEDTEHGQMEWFFMGTSHEAAYLHIDHTIKPAWQAQVRGRKVWELHPPAECYFQCPPVQAHLQDGDLFVVDPSVWYHGTFIYPGELSITFGMEFV